MQGTPSHFDRARSRRVAIAAGQRGQNGIRTWPQDAQPTDTVRRLLPGQQKHERVRVHTGKRCGCSTEGKNRVNAKPFAETPPSRGRGDSFADVSGDEKGQPSAGREVRETFQQEVEMQPNAPVQSEAEALESEGA